MVVLLLLWCCFAIVLLSIITLLVVLATQVSIFMPKFFWGFVVWLRSPTFDLLTLVLSSFTVRSRRVEIKRLGANETINILPIPLSVNEDLKWRLSILRVDFTFFWRYSYKYSWRNFYHLCKHEGKVAVWIIGMHTRHGSLPKFWLYWRKMERLRDQVSSLQSCNGSRDWESVWYGERRCGRGCETGVWCISSLEKRDNKGMMGKNFCFNQRKCIHVARIILEVAFSSRDQMFENGEIIHLPLQLTNNWWGNRVLCTIFILHNTWFKESRQNSFGIKIWKLNTFYYFPLFSAYANA